MERHPFVTLTALMGTVGLIAATEQGDRRMKWEAPEAARAVENPVPDTPEAMRDGLSLYEKNCLTCHGAKGKGNGPAARFVESSPADLSNPQLQSRMTDGEVFWKISEGRNPMPSFKKKLSEDERWKLVRYVRSLRARRD